MLTDVVTVIELAIELVLLGANNIANDSGEVSAHAVVALKVLLVVTFSYAHPGTTVLTGIPGGNL